MAVPLRVPAGRRQLAISQTSFLPGSAERGDVLIFRVDQPGDARSVITWGKTQRAQFEEVAPVKNSGPVVAARRTPIRPTPTRRPVSPGMGCGRRHIRFFPRRHALRRPADPFLPARGSLVDTVAFVH